MQDYDYWLEKAYHPENFDIDLTEEELEKEAAYEDLLSEPEYTEDQEPTREVFEEKEYQGWI